MHTGRIYARTAAAYLLRRRVLASSKRNVAELTERAARIWKLLELRYPAPKSHLVYKNAWELMVATVLAAQCTDARVNTITPEFFRRWPGPAELQHATQEEVEEVIHSAGFYHSKAKNLLGAAKRVMEVHGGEVPHTLEELVHVPGVARKTANVVLWGAFGINEGLAVDTHVKRISFRLGLTTYTDPVHIERDLMEIFPRPTWGDVNHRLVWFGRDVCDARRPDCHHCELAEICPHIGVTEKMIADDSEAEDKPAKKTKKPAAKKAVKEESTVEEAQSAPKKRGRPRKTAE